MPPFSGFQVFYRGNNSDYLYICREMKGTETMLAARIRAGDREAFDTLCRERYASLIAYARLFLSGFNAAWAEDVVQDVLFGVWTNRARLKEDGTDLQAYLLRSVYHRSLNYLKKARRSSLLSETGAADLLSLVVDRYDPDRNPAILNLFRADVRTSLEKAISSLPEQRRKIVSLSYLEDLSNKEISDLLGLSLSTVENHKYLALKQLREGMKKN